MSKLQLNDITLISICGDARFLVNIIRAAQCCIEQVNFKKVKILSNVATSLKDIEIIKIPSLNQKQYCEFSLYELHKHVDTEFCLTFQGDGFIIGPEYWDKKFMTYDYIGAPWPHDPTNQVGNGGFSLRSKKFMISTSKLVYNSSLQFQDDIPAGELISPEDWFACVYSYRQMIDMNIKFADLNTAYRFSVEHPSEYKSYDPYKIKTYQSFGFHGAFNVAAMQNLNRTSHE